MNNFHALLQGVGEWRGKSTKIFNTVGVFIYLFIYFTWKIISLSFKFFFKQKQRRVLYQKNVFPLSKGCHKPFLAKRITRKPFWWCIAREWRVDEINSRVGEVWRKVFKGNVLLPLCTFNMLNLLVLLYISNSWNLIEA